MKRILLMSFLIFLLSQKSLAQAEPQATYTNFPIIISIQFHALSMPFKNIKSNFGNPGIGIGTEVSLNGKENWAQQFQVVWYRNKAVGNGLLFFTQSAWRPTIADEAYAELKAGIGYLVSSRPVTSFKMIDGEWKNVGHKGKGMLTLPVGASLGYNIKSATEFVSPFMSYQFLLVNGYNQSIPLVPETLIQVGARFHTHQ